jgi:hypothetical protein
MALVQTVSAAAAAVVGTIAIAASVNLGAGTIGCPANLRPCNAANIRDDGGNIIGQVRTGEPVTVTGKADGDYTPVKSGKIEGWMYTPFLEAQQNAASTK